jgi:hypothetical protein
VHDRGNRMSPTHSNKLGVRYWYYVSHAALNHTPEASARFNVIAQTNDDLLQMSVTWLAQGRV